MRYSGGGSRVRFIMVMIAPVLSFTHQMQCSSMANPFGHA
jgi:hypothetical protein